MQAANTVSVFRFRDWVTPGLLEKATVCTIMAKEVGSEAIMLTRCRY